MHRTTILSLGLFFWILILNLPAFGQAPAKIGNEFFEQHGAIMLLIDPQSGAIVDANQAAARFYGYSVEDLRRMRIQQINILTDSEIRQERSRAEKERNNYFIFRHRLASGEIRTVEVFSSPVRIESRKLLFSIIHDVTHRADFQAQLARDETRLRHAEQVAEYGHWIFDVEQKRYTLSEGAEEILGLDGEQWADQAVGDLFLPASRAAIIEGRRRLIEDGEPYDLRLRVKRKGDDEILDLQSIATYDPEKGQIFGIVKDVTDSARAMREVERQSRQFVIWMTLAVVVQSVVILFLILVMRKLKNTKRALSAREATLREHSEMIGLLLDSTAEAIYGLDLDGRCTFCNAASLRMLGYERTDQLIGRNMHKLIHHTHADGTPWDVTDCSIYKALQQREGTHVDSEVLWRADGTSFPAEYWSYPIFRDEELIGVVVTFLDITARKKAEQALNDKNAELEQFTYAVSHDLKSPLVTITTFLEFLQKDMAEDNREKIERDIAFMESATEKMQRLIGELLEISQVGLHVNVSAVVSFRELVDEVLETVAGGIAERGVAVHIADADIDLLGDRPRLTEIWLNLIENSVKYMGDQDTPRIDLGVDAREAGPVFYVRDNGMGIDPRYRTKVFDIFERLDPHSEGTGLGLAKVKKVVELNGGRIWVESTESGQGSCFRFTLPAATAGQTFKPGKKDLI